MENKTNTHSPRFSVYRKEHFNAAHRLYNPAWSDEKNFSIFGKCSWPHYHGHNYELVVCVTGPLDAETGMVMDLKSLSEIIYNYVIEPFDHKNLNLDVPDFHNLITSAENIAMVIYNRIRPHIPEHLDMYVELYETPRNYVRYPV
ncbi:MAG: 6-carboxytetrahydropterin synthase [Bacteroidia bacterium]|nr:6-carboxytetrahydropterin synthase [Bacteroidia bacterium]